MTRPYIIAEFATQRRLGARNGVDGGCEGGGRRRCELQTYTADTMTIDCDREDFIIKGGPWDGYNP